MRILWQTVAALVLWTPTALAQPAQPTPRPAEPLTLNTPPLSAPLPFAVWTPSPRLLDVPRSEQLVTSESHAPGGFINLQIPEKITVLSVGRELGLFAGKMLLLKSLCEWGNCRVNTGPGDLSAGWVEQMSGLDPLPANFGHRSTKLRGAYSD